MMAEADSKLEEVYNENLPDFQMPPTKAEKKKYFGNSLINKFKTNFETKCWRTPNYAVTSFHVLLGQLENIRNIKIRVGNNYQDCRVHMLLLQESGSGKGAGFSYMSDVCNETNISFHATGDLTNSALAGSMKPQEDGSAELKPGILDPQYNDGQGVNILASGEASQVIDTRNRHFDKNALLNLQKAMNPIGTADNVVRKETGVSDQIIEFNSSVSLYLTTFKPTKLFQTMTQTGFLQRVVLLYNPVSLEDKMKVGQMHLDMLESDNVAQLNNKNIVNALKYINSYYKDVDSLVLTDEARKGFKKDVLPHIYRPLLNLETNTMHEVKKFTTRYQVLLYKLAWHHAISRLSTRVEVQDVAYAKRVFLPIFKKLVAFMENEYDVEQDKKIETRSDKQLIKNTYKHFEKHSDADNPLVYKREVVKKLCDEWGVSEEAGRHRLERYISMFDVKTTKRGLKVLKLREQER